MRRVTIAGVAAIMATSLTVPQPLSAALSGDPTSVTAEAKPGTASATISWTAPSGATRFQARAFIGNVAVRVSNVLSASTTSFTFVGLEYRVPYSLKVTAGDASTWGTEITATPSTVTPDAAAPSAPEKPTLSVVADETLEVTWAAPTNSGGATIDYYLVQLKKQGDNIVDPVTVKGLSTTISTKDSKNPFSVSVKAVNAMAKVSPESEDSEAVIPQLRAASVVPVNNPSSNNPSSNNPSSNNPSSNNPSQSTPPGRNSGIAAPTAADPAASAPSASPAANGTLPTKTPSTQKPYTRAVTIGSKTTTKTLLALSKLKTSKTSRVSYSVAPASRKVCTLTAGNVTATQAGTCSVTVTVRTGKTSSSRTVKLTIASAKY